MLRALAPYTSQTSSCRAWVRAKFQMLTVELPKSRNPMEELPLSQPGPLQKQILRHGIKCRFLIWEVVSGNSTGVVGKRDQNGIAANTDFYRKDVCSGQLKHSPTGSSKAHTSELVCNQGLEGCHIYYFILHWAMNGIMSLSSTG